MTRQTLPPEIKEVIDRAFGLRKGGDRLKALELMETIREAIADDATAQTVCAIFSFELDDFSNAARSARRAIELKPTSERASGILFHSLWNLGERDDAFAEMCRLLAIRESSEYRRLLSDLGANLQSGKLDEPTAIWLRGWLKKLPFVRG